MKILPNTSKFYVDFTKKFLKDRKNCYVPSFPICLAPGQTNLCAESPPISIVSRLNRMRNFNGCNFFHACLFPYCSNAWFPKYCGKKGTSQPRKELRSDPASCPFVWAPSWKVGWRHHISSSGCGPDWHMLWNDYHVLHHHSQFLWIVFETSI